MKILKLLLFICLSQIISQKMYAQSQSSTETNPTVVWNDDGSVTVVGEKEFIYTSTSEDFIGFDRGVIDGFNIDLSGGIVVDKIKATSEHTSPVQTRPDTADGVFLEMYLTGEDLSDSFVYGCFATQNDPYSFQEDYWKVSNFNYFFASPNSTSIKTLFMDFVKKNYTEKIIVFSYTKEMPKKLSVKIKVTVRNATLKQVKIPGIGEKTPMELFSPEPSVMVTVTAPNGTQKGTYIYKKGESPSAIEAIMGDQVTFQVIGNNNSVPTIKGLPATWLAPTCREYYYHCDPSITPGGLKPKIPFDIQSHYVSSNGVSKEYYPSWQTETSNSNIHTLNWIVQRQTNTNSNKYQAQYKFKKADVLNRKLQRKNKTEGQIMDFLEIWKKGMDFTPVGYRYYDTNRRRYYWNVDSDELLYFNSKEYDTKKEGWNGHIKRVPLYSVEKTNDPYSLPSLASTTDVENSIGSLYEPWQLIREGDYMWDVTTGYPSSGFVINELVNAYRLYNNLPATYNGYEIEDYCLYKDKEGNCYQASNTAPAEIGSGVVYNRDGNGLNDNNRHPGTVSITVGGVAIAIPMQVETPLAEDHGFYGNIITPSYSNVKSTFELKVIGLPKNLSDTEKSRYSLEIRSYSLQDFPVKTYKLHDQTDQTGGTYDSNTGTWTIPVTSDYNQGQSATLYYSRDPEKYEETKVIINGAEWKNTTIPYVFTKSGKDNQSNDYLDLKTTYEDFSDNYVQKKRYAYDYSQGYINNYDGKTYWPTYLRHYVLNKNDKKVLFSCMDALDNMWDMHGNAYYWGYRTLAKQITDEILAENLIYKLTDLATGITTEHPGRDFEFDPSVAGVGDYELQIYSKNGGDPSAKVKIKVVDFGETVDNKPIRANIYTRELYAQERKCLNLEGHEYDKYRVATINDVLATYLYVDGPRAAPHDGSKNRFAVHNDFRDEFRWTKTSGSTETDVTNIPEVQNLINRFDPTSYWNSEWKDWLRHFSYGKFPKSTVTADLLQTEDFDIQDYLGELFTNTAANTKYLFKDAPYLRGLIWLAPTDYDGYRVNGLMKTIVNLDSFFNDYAFKEVVTPPEMDMLPAFVNQDQDLSDAKKYELYLLQRLKDGGMIIYNPDEVTNLSVYNKKDPDSDRYAADIFMAGNNHLSGIPLFIGQDIVSNMEYGSEKNTDGKSSFPIPAGVTSYLNLYGLLLNKESTLDLECITDFGDQYGGLGEDPDGNLVIARDENGNIIPYNKGAGPINTRLLADTYPNSDLSIGLMITSISSCGKLLADMKGIKMGGYDLEIKRLAKFCNSRHTQTIYLRIGYEFDLIWNPGYENPDEYKKAYRHIVEIMKSEGVTNVKYVWQAAFSPYNIVDYLAANKGIYSQELMGNRSLHDPSDLQAWYPELQTDTYNYVDIVGFSWFENSDEMMTDAAKTKLKNNMQANPPITDNDINGFKTKRQLTDALLGIARAHNKPVMVAEATPRAYDIGKLTRSVTHLLWDGSDKIWDPWDSDITKRKNVVLQTYTAQSVWDNFYQPLFDYVEANGDVIKYFHYIDADWSSESQWQWNTRDQYWGDCRVQKNPDIKKKWQNEINKPKWIHGNSLHGPVNTTAYPFEAFNVGSTTVDLRWLGNDQPAVQSYKLEFYYYEDNGVLYPVEGVPYLIPAPPVGGTFTKEIQGLSPSMAYRCKLSYLDYYGKPVGLTATVDFTTDGSAKRGNNLIKENIETDFLIYPNPTKGELNIRFGLEQASTVHIELFDLSGRLLFYESEYREKGNQECRFNNLRNYTKNSGIFFLKIVTDKSTIVKKIMIK